ncbi:MAG TPA: CCA tRNA nucleotidyltransferase [Dehalococcoidia bacterium]|nr:CCA tRNA nucleotidyltransferase [Dehalococcoidia bacterium]
MKDRPTRITIEGGTAFLLARVRDFLASQVSHAYLVGGFVRDALLGRATTDIDVSVAGEAQLLARSLADALGGKYVLLDQVHQVARVVLFLEDGRWFVDLSALRGDIEADLGDRDFTIDAMALPLFRPGDDSRPSSQVEWSTEHIIDPHGGLADLRKRRIRVVRQRAFEHDPVRLLRAVRLASQLGFAIEMQTRRLIQDKAGLIKSGAPERVRDELCLILGHPEAAQYLHQLHRLGLLLNIIPELAPTVGSKQPKEHFWNVFEHSLETVAAVGVVLQERRPDFACIVPWSETLAEHFDREVSSGHSRRVLLKLAALLHDIAKPHTRSLEESGRIRFFGHAREGASQSALIMDRLRFSNREIRLVETAIRYHLRPVQMAGGEGLPTRRAMYRYFRDAGEAAIDTLFLSLADHLAARGPTLDLASWQQHAEQVGYVLEQHFKEKSLTRPPKLVDGHDLMQSLGLEPGPSVGRLLEMVREAQAAGEVATREEALALARRYLEAK